MLAVQVVVVCPHVLLIVVLSVHKDLLLLLDPPPPPLPCESQEESHVTQSHNDWSAETTLFLTLVAPCFSDIGSRCWVFKVHMKHLADLK